jgi:hypothetical protein
MTCQLTASSGQYKFVKKDLKNARNFPKLHNKHAEEIWYMTTGWLGIKD